MAPEFLLNKSQDHFQQSAKTGAVEYANCTSAEE